MLLRGVDRVLRLRQFEVRGISIEVILSGIPLNSLGIVLKRQVILCRRKYKIFVQAIVDIIARRKSKIEQAMIRYTLRSTNNYCWPKETTGTLVIETVYYCYYIYVLVIVSIPLML